MNDLISVIMSTYNENLEYIREAINSILNQTYKNIEIVIINDNPSRVDIDKLINDYNQGNIKYIRNIKNVGLANCMNIAAQLASGIYLARMDADDISDMHRLEKEYNYLITHHLRIVSTAYSLIDEQGNAIAYCANRYSSELINSIIPYYSPICHPTVMIEKELFIVAGGYNNYPCSQDYDLWLRLYFKQSVRFGYINEPLYFYRTRENSITSLKNYQQYYTSLFQRKTIKSGGSFSLTKYSKYMQKKGVYNKKKTDRFKLYYLMHKKMKNKHKYIKPFREAFMLMTSTLYRNIMLNEMRKVLIYKVMLKSITNRKGVG